jgi:hypothetical protein
VQESVKQNTKLSALYQEFTDVNAAIFCESRLEIGFVYWVAQIT